MKMKLFLGLAAFVCLFSACNNDDDNIGNWVQDNFFNGIPRDGQVSFTLEENGEDVAYVGLGVNTTADEDDDDERSSTYGDFITDDGVFSDFWKFKQDASGRRVWTQVASLVQATGADSNNKLVARRNAVAFAAAGKGFVGTGQTYSPETSWEEVKDFYRYEPNGDTWTRIEDYPGGNIYNAVAFGIGNYGYVGLGINSRTVNTFFRFNAETETWDKNADTGNTSDGFGFPGEKREGAQAFVINGFGYVISGRNNGVELYDVWKLDPATLAWTEQIKLDNSDYDFENVRRSYGAAWSLNGRGYVGTGTRGGSSLVDVWEFDPSSQEWTEKQDFEGRARRKAAAFVLDGTAYLGGGGTSNSNAYDDFYRFDPFAEYDSED